MENRPRFRFRFCIVLALLAWSAPTFAIDDSIKGAARELSSAGKEDFDAGKYDLAAQKFEKAYEAVKVPTLALWSARSEVRLGHLVAASELYRQALQLTPNELWVGTTQQEAQAEAQRELDALLPRIPKLRVLVTGGEPSEVAITVDNVALPAALVGVDRPTDPGKRRIIGKRGGENADVVMELKEGETKELILKFSGVPLTPVAPLPGPAVATPHQPTSLAALPAQPVSPNRGNAAPSSAARTLGWISLSVGAAGVIEGAVTGIFVIQRYAKLKDNCPNDVCNPRVTDNYRMDMYNALRTASMVGFIVGGVGLAAGTTLLLTSPASPERVGIGIGPGTASVYGAF